MKKILRRIVSRTCGRDTCLKLAYWSQQAGLATFFEPKSPLYKHEGDKAEAIKQVLTTSQLYLSLYDTESADSERGQFCRQIFDDLKQMKGIRFIDPVVQTQSYEDPALDKWKQQCGSKPPLHFSYSCVPRILNYIKSYKDTLDQPECYKGFGLPPFKLYELPPETPTSKPRSILYADNKFGSGTWEYSDNYSTKIWTLAKPQMGHGGFAGFQQIDSEKCERILSGAWADITDTIGNRKNYSSIIEYKKQYYFLILGERLSNYWLEITTSVPNRSKKMKNCLWTSAAPKPDLSN